MIKKVLGYMVVRQSDNSAMLFTDLGKALAQAEASQTDMILLVAA